MAIIIVEHRTSEPALYGAMASIVARARGARAAHLPVIFDTGRLHDAVQHVTADGFLVPSGLVWFERIAGLAMSRETSIEQIVRQAKDGDVVVPIAPGDETHCMELLSRAGAAGVATERVEAASHRDRYGFVDWPSPGPDKTPATWRRDRFGRFEPVGRAAPSQAAAPPPLRIALVGTEGDHRDIYPSALAALGDAADSVGIALDVLFVPPIGLRDDDAKDIVYGIDGMLLPGGSDMANVPGQILMAHAALRSLTPALGLCLGMQTMTTAVARQAPDLSKANLAEADPSAPIKTFTPIAGNSPTAHRLGEQQISLRPGSRLHALLGPTHTIRCNHRYRLNPALVGELSQAGLVATAHDRGGTIVEAVELQGHPFFVGMQGHPELTSRKNLPHPLIKAFLVEAASKKAARMTA